MHDVLLTLADKFVLGVCTFERHIIAVILVANVSTDQLGEAIVACRK